MFPFHIFFLRGRTGLITLRTGVITRIEPILLHVLSPSYYKPGALKQGVGAERPSPTHGAVAAVSS